LNALYEIAIDADSIARAIVKAIEQPGDVSAPQVQPRKSSFCWKNADSIALLITKPALFSNN
jgi:hypothetical protein